MNKEKIKCDGAVRKILIDAMIQVRDDKMNLDKAQTLALLGGVINGSMNASSRMRAVSIMAGELVPKFGQIVIEDVPGIGYEIDSQQPVGRVSEA